MENGLQKKIQEEVNKALPISLTESYKKKIQEKVARALPIELEKLTSRPTMIQRKELAQNPNHQRNYESEEAGETPQLREQHSDHQEIFRATAKRNLQIVGTKVQHNSRLKVGDRSAWLFIGKLHKETTTADVVAYLEENGITGNIEAEDLLSKGPNKSFRVMFPLDQLEQINEPNFWPRTVVVRRWRFHATRELEGAQLRRRETIPDKQQE